MYYPNRFDDKETLKKAIDDYIYFYNYERLQNRYGNQIPMEVEQYPIPENKKIQKYYQNLELKKQVYSNS